MLQYRPRSRESSGIRAGWVAACGLAWAVVFAVLPCAAAEPAEQAAAAVDEPAPAEPGEVVESLHDVLIEAMKTSDTTSFEDRYQKIEDNLKRTFDLPFMARASIGGTWKTLSPQTRESWVELSLRYSASKYADSFQGYSGQRFVTHSVEPAARGTMLVKTELIQLQDDNVTFDYRMRKVDGEWRIIDIQLDGKISEITLRRADYRSVIENRGFDELVKEIHIKVEDLASS